MPSPGLLPAPLPAPLPFAWPSALPLEPVLEWLPTEGWPEQLIVLLHGWRSDARAMVPLAEALRAAFPQAAVVAPDSPLAFTRREPLADPAGRDAGRELGRMWYSIDDLHTSPEVWPARVAEYLNERQAEEREPVVVNLASIEYARVALRVGLRARVIHCVFEDWKGGEFKVISFFAKKARGMMARHLIAKRARSPKTMESFTTGGYALDRASSTPERWVFRRREAA